MALRRAFGLLHALLWTCLLRLACGMTGRERYELAMAGRRAVLEQQGADASTIEAELSVLKARIAHWKDLPAIDLDVFERLQREVLATREEALSEAARAQQDEVEAPWTRRARAQVQAHFVNSIENRRAGSSVPNWGEEAMDATWQDPVAEGCGGVEEETARKRREAEEKLQHLSQDEKEELYRNHAGFRKQADKLGLEVGKKSGGECKRRREALKNKIDLLRKQAQQGASRPQYHATATEQASQERQPKGSPDSHGKDEL
eukprot:scaffold1501_cov352-Pavlova_lutheri.AAC.44